MALIQTVHLSMANFKSAPVVPAVQNDTDRQVKMIVDDFDLTSGMTGKIAFQRSDGTHYETAATLNASDNSFTADIDQALTQPGRTMVQLKVTDTLTVSTFSFVIFVEQDNSGTVTPQEGIDLVSAVQAAEDAADRAESAASTFETDTSLSVSGMAADAKTVGDDLDAIDGRLDTIEDDYVTESEMSAAISATVTDVANLSSAVNDYFGLNSVTLTANSEYPKTQLNVTSGQTYFIRILKVIGDSGLLAIYVNQGSDNPVVGLETGDLKSFTAVGDNPAWLIARYSSTPSNPPTIIYELADSENYESIVSIVNNIEDTTSNYLGVKSLWLDRNSEYPWKVLDVVSGHTYKIRVLYINNKTNLRTIYIYQGTTLAGNLENGVEQTFTPASGDTPVRIVASYSAAPIDRINIVFELVDTSVSDPIDGVYGALEDTINATVSDAVFNADNVVNYLNIFSVKFSANGRYPRAEIPATSGHKYYIRILSIDNKTGFETIYVNQGTTANTIAPALEGGVISKFEPTGADKVYLFARYASEPSVLPTVVYELVEATNADATLSVLDNKAALLAMSGNVKAVNHRGYNVQAPENTLPAYIMSKQYGFNYVETDVQFTSDGVAVLLHDLTINRTGRNPDGTTISSTVNISDITYEEALEYDFGIKIRNVYAGTKIPTFEEFIALCRNIGLMPYVELKSDAEYTQAQIESLVDIAKKYGMRDKTTWISFSSTLLGYVSAYEPSSRIGYLVNTISSEEIAVAKSLGNNVYISAYYADVTDALVELCVDEDIALEVWTVDDPDVIASLNPYISGVASDNLIAGVVLYKDSIV